VRLTRDRSPVRLCRSPGSVRGVGRKAHSYREHRIRDLDDLDNRLSARIHSQEDEGPNPGDRR
jgi:hypothetical protein